MALAGVTCLCWNFRRRGRLQHVTGHDQTSLSHYQSRRMCCNGILGNVYILLNSVRVRGLLEHSFTALFMFISVVQHRNSFFSGYMEIYYQTLFLRLFILNLKNQQLLFSLNIYNTVKTFFAFLRLWLERILCFNEGNLLESEILKPYFEVKLFIILLVEKDKKSISSRRGV